MTTKNKNKSETKAQKKLTLKKELIRDLSPGPKATAVRGGIQTTSEGVNCNTFGTLG